MKNLVIVWLLGFILISADLFSAGRQEKPPEAAELKPVNVRIATSPPYAEGSPMVEFAVKLQEYAARYSKGLVNVQIFWGGQLGDEQKVFQDAQVGIIQGVIANIANLAAFSKALYPVTLPYLFETRKQAYDLFRGDLGKYFTEQTVETTRIRVLAWPDQGFRALHNTRRRVQTVADARGLKWRVPNNPVFIEMYKSWGVDPIPMGWAEVFSSLQTGVIHGGDNVLRNLIDFKMYEFEKYATLSDHMLEIVPFGISEVWFQKQPAEYQDALTRAAADAWEQQFSAMTEDLKTTVQILRDKGMVIDEAQDTSEWRKARDIWPQFYELMGGRQVLDEVLSFIK